MIDDMMRDEYDVYLDNHIANVKKGLDWMIKYMPEIFKIDPVSLSMIISHHDESKYSDEEYFAYCEYFYGKEKTTEIEENFDLAWLHHQHNNPHHWQHWLLREDDGDMKALEMPEVCIIEMVVDWWSFSWKSGNLYEIFNWYENNKSKMLLHSSTLLKVEHILESMKIQLDSINH